MPSILEPNWLVTAITREARRQADEIVGEEIRAAQERIEQKLKSMVSQIALNAVEHFDIRSNEHNFVITVRKHKDQGKNAS